MKMSGTLRGGRVLWIPCAVLAILMAAFVGSASPGLAQPPATPAAVEATLVALCTSSTVFATAIAGAADRCSSATPVPTATQRSLGLQATPTPPVFVLLPAPSIKTGLVGSVLAPAGAPLSSGPPFVFGDRIALGMEGLWDPAVGSRNGDGIYAVTFTIADAFGRVVHKYTTSKGSEFCAFGGQTPNCTVWDFSTHANRWPGGDTVHSGRFTLFAFAQGDEPQHKGTWTADFEIRLPADRIAGKDGAVLILGVGERNGRYVAVYDTVGFEPNGLGSHLRFYFDNIDPVTTTSTKTVRDIPAAGDPATGLFDGFAIADRPKGARALCVAILQADATIVPDSSACAALP